MVYSTARTAVAVAVAVVTLAVLAQGRPRAGTAYSAFYGALPCPSGTLGPMLGSADPNSVTAVHLRVPTPVLAPLVVPSTFRPGVFAPSSFLAIRHDAQTPTAIQDPAANEVASPHQILFPSTMLLSAFPMTTSVGGDDEDEGTQNVFMFMPAAAPQFVFGERHDVQAAPMGVRKPAEEVHAFMRDPTAPSPAVESTSDPVETLFGVPPPPDTLYSTPSKGGPPSDDSGAALGMSLPKLDSQGRPLVQVSTFPQELPNPFFDASGFQRGEEEMGEGGAFHGVVPAGIAQALQPIFETVAFENSKAHPSILGKRPSEDGDAVVVA
ncbi:uncharacterized protein LOC143030714 [Oratosquilla oratoria]|uniref:uncharacterized protein LOC143030714 n=1 Tax=Oratosquilla oratoria TaxID=337810 RepID=UPI003F76A54A